MTYRRSRQRPGCWYPASGQQAGISRHKTWYWTRGGQLERRLWTDLVTL